MEKRHKRVILTLAIALLVLICAFLFKMFQLPHKHSFNINGQPTVGKGPMQLVLFEDLACINCHHFTKDVVPKIAAEYIDTGKARFTIVPVSFEPNSIHLANAALAVHRIAPNRFLSFIVALLEVKENSKQEIIQVAEKVGGIDLERLAYAIDRRIFFGEIERNLSWAMSLIPDFGTPMLFINGYETSTDSFESIQKRMEQLGIK